MFYILHKRKLIPIDPDRIYTFCPRCGTLHAVDLQTVIETAGPEFDLCKTAMYCHDCSRDEYNRKKALYENGNMEVSCRYSDGWLMERQWGPVTHWMPLPEPPKEVSDHDQG